MANYRIIISKREPNPNFAEELEAFEKNNRFGRNNFNEYDVPGMPKKEISSDVLICEVTEEQYKKIKLEALKAFQ